MWISPDPNKFSHKFRYVELMRWLPNTNSFMREKGLFDVSEVADYCEKHSNIGLFKSVWQYDSPDLKSAKRLGSLYFDLDSEDLELVRAETSELLNYLLTSLVPSNAIRIYYTGKKGFCIECEALTLGIAPSEDLPDLFRFIANQINSELKLTTLDFSVYDSRRMWRIPNTKHQSTGLYKAEINRSMLNCFLTTIQMCARDPSGIMDNSNKVQEFDIKANEWYRNFIYKREEKKTISLEERINKFNRRGSNTIVSSDHLEFDPVSLFTNCKAMSRIWTKAETTHDLSHEERLFLCSILTYTDEAIEYLHAILSLCDDYNENISQAHIDDWIKRRESDRGGRPFTCRKLNEMSIGCGDCDLEPKPKYYRIGDKLIDSGDTSEPSPIRWGYTRKKMS